jgi:hypothetical protein
MEYLRVPPTFMCVVQVHNLDDAHEGAEDGLRMLATSWLYRGLHPGGRHAGDRGLSEAIWKSIMGRNSKLPAPLRKKIIGSEPGVWAESRWQKSTLERIGR